MSLLIKQIGIMGSAADLWYDALVAEKAFALWKKLAESWYVVVYGAEKDSDSLSTAAARGAKSGGWITVGVTYGKQSDIWGEMKDQTDVIVCTGMERWGGRELVLVSSCDAIITLGGGSGTLNEMTIAYQKKIPIVCMRWTGGWTDKLAWEYIDERYKQDTQRFICQLVETVEDAISYIQSLS